MDKVLRSIYDVVHRHPGGGTEIAKTMGCYHTNTINNKADPYNETHQMSLADVIAITKITRDNEIIESLAYEVGLGVYALPAGETKQETLLRLITGLGEKRGEVDHALHEALADGEISEREQKIIHDKAVESITALLSLLAHIDDAVCGGVESRNRAIETAREIVNKRRA